MVSFSTVSCFLVKKFYKAPVRQLESSWWTKWSIQQLKRQIFFPSRAGRDQSWAVKKTGLTFIRRTQTPLRWNDVTSGTDDVKGDDRWGCFCSKWNKSGKTNQTIKYWIFNCIQFSWIYFEIDVLSWYFRFTDMLSWHITIYWCLFTIRKFLRRSNMHFL